MDTDRHDQIAIGDAAAEERGLPFELGDDDRLKGQGAASPVDFPDGGAGPDRALPTMAPQRGADARQRGRGWRRGPGERIRRVPRWCNAPRKSGSWGRPTAPARAGGRHRSYRRRTRATRWRRRSGRARPAPRAPRSRPRPRQLGDDESRRTDIDDRAGLDPDGGDDTIILGNEGGIAQRIAGKTDRPLGPHQAASPHRQWPCRSKRRRR